MNVNVAAVAVVGFTGPLSSLVSGGSIVQVWVAPTGSTDVPSTALTLNVCEPVPGFE